ncbi:MAG: hypothetical protein ABEK01_03300 [Candidatus Nanohaloarchaea archaeon]
MKIENELSGGLLEDETVEENLESYEMDVEREVEEVMDAYEISQRLGRYGQLDGGEKTRLEEDYREMTGRDEIKSDHVKWDDSGFTENYWAEDLVDEMVGDVSPQAIYRAAGRIDEKESWDRGDTFFVNALIDRSEAEQFAVPDTDIRNIGFFTDKDILVNGEAPGAGFMLEEGGRLFVAGEVDAYSAREMKGGELYLSDEPEEFDPLKVGNGEVYSIDEGEKMKEEAVRFLRDGDLNERNWNQRHPANVTERPLEALQVSLMGEDEPETYLLNPRAL